MKERKAAPVSRVEAATQVVPAADFVDCFVSDDLLENGRRRLPVDPPQDEEAAVEPRRQQPFEIAVDGGERLVRFDVPHQVAAQRDDVGGGTRRQVQAPEEFEPRAVRRLLQTRQRCCRRIVEVGARRLGNGDRVGLHLVGKKAVKSEALIARRLFQLDQQLTRDRNTGGFAATRHQRPRQHLDRLAAARTKKRFGQAAPGPARQRNSSVLVETRRSRADPLRSPIQRR